MTSQLTSRYSSHLSVRPKTFFNGNVHEKISKFIMEPTEMMSEKQQNKQNKCCKCGKYCPSYCAHINYTLHGKISNKLCFNETLILIYFHNNYYHNISMLYIK